MSVKKMLLLGAASVAAVGATAAVAGGYTHQPMMQSQSGYYIEGHAGYASQDYYNDINWANGSGVRANNHGNVYGGFSGGLDAGYKINNNFGVETGWFWLPDVNFANANAVNGPQYLQSWVLYLAGKYMTAMPWMNNTDWFFKLGVDFRRATLPSVGIVAGSTQTLNVKGGTSNYIRPMFATGLDYSFSDAWSGIVQYAYFMGARNSFSKSGTPNNTGSYGTVAANVVTLGLGYKFTL